MCVVLWLVVESLAIVDGVVDLVVLVAILCSGTTVGLGSSRARSAFGGGGSFGSFEFEGCFLFLVGGFGLFEDVGQVFALVQESRWSTIDRVSVKTMCR